ncbi:MAG: GNAT family N-acetyltransferase [Burkholderiales bacterium]
MVGSLYVANRVLRRISARCGLYVYELMVQPISSKPMLPANLAKNLTFEELESGHPDIARMPAREDIKALRFEQGARCLGVYRKGQMIGFIWFCFNVYLEDEVRCTYQLSEPERSVFDFDLYVFPEHRMGIGFMAIWHGANSWLRERGVEYTFSRLTRFNLASRKSHAHLKWKRVGVALFLQLWRTEVMLATVSPFVAATSSRDKRVLLRLGPDVLRANEIARPNPNGVS